ncbi:HAD family hydrolase [Sphingomonas canadensis]|uniref:HAD family hydrolase n=1 Tax=Sphingomonas canadensis TaxID=1219257 RepID=A0ABW3H632_9SPHN|nr:HAD-IB family hydrolase [Sphingomonas canadensis]MCW3835008.1 HAD-IB family hydrolase [Sphingomonas canadensis]
MQHLAFYDMDKTVTRLPTWTRFLVHAARRRAPWRLALLPAAGAATIGYALGLTGRAGLKQVTQRIMLGGAVAPAEMDGIAESFADAVIADHVLDGARARMAEDRAAGYRLVLATASHAFYAAEIGRRLGFDDVIATRAQRAGNGHVLPAIEGENCYGPAKLRMVQGWMTQQGIARGDAHIRAYSDHVSDAPLLSWADEGFAVNAHGPLKALAKAQGWPELDWR